VTKELGIKGPFQPYTFPNFSGMLSAAQGGLKNLGEIIQGEQNTLMQKPTAVAGLTWVKDNHTYKFGAEMRLQGYPNYNVLGTNGSYSFTCVAPCSGSPETALPYLNTTLMSGGTIGLLSVTGQGCTFRITLPRARRDISCCDATPGARTSV